MVSPVREWGRVVVPSMVAAGAVAAGWPPSTTASRINALFDGINHTEGASKRPVRWGEPNNKNSIYSQLIKPGGMPNVAFTLNGFYDNWLSGSDGPNAGGTTWWTSTKA